jgi:hypothetical protein
VRHDDEVKNLVDETLLVSVAWTLPSIMPAQWAIPAPCRCNRRGLSGHL